MTDEQKNFIETVGTLAKADVHGDKILPSLTIAQAILESGWGKSSLTRKANALFGIKATAQWKGRVFSCKTQECYDGISLVPAAACFRAYDSWAESIADHGAFLCGLSRYKAVVGEIDYKAACKAVKAAGYATDPEYAGKLIRIIETYKLHQYDAPEQRTYTVVKGDTLTKIARRFSTTVDALVEKNRVKYPRMTRDYIQAGWTLDI